MKSDFLKITIFTEKVMDCKKRERAANFNTTEIHLLLNLIVKFKQIIENKKNDAVSNKNKENAWKKIENSFNACGVTSIFRSWKTLKLKYEGLKKTTKKKLYLQRQGSQIHRESTNAAEFDGIEEKVISICCDMKELETRRDSDTKTPIPFEEVTLEPTAVHSSDTPQQKSTESYAEENKCENWYPEALKPRPTNSKPDIATKASATSVMDKLRAARLELVQLQIETARKQQRFMEEEHKLKMFTLANDERRKEEIHDLLLKKHQCSPGTIGTIYEDACQDYDS